MTKFNKLLANKSGFTIIELMIATAILSVLLLVSSIVMISIGNLFEKGVNITNLQNVTRNFMSSVTSDIEYSGASITYPPVSQSYAFSSNGTTVNETVYAVCIGSTRYSYVLSFPPSGWPHTIWKDVMQTQGSCYPLNLGQSNPSCPISAGASCVSSIEGTGSELAGKNMHLEDFSITPYSNQLYGVKVNMVYGSQDLFENPSHQLVTSPINQNYVCQNVTGQQFCATSSLTALAVESL